MFKDNAANILMECAELIERKSQDYNNGRSRDEYALYGRLSHMNSIHTKYLRLRSLLEQPTHNFEGVEDTLKDLCNYCAIFIDWERRNGNNTTDTQ